MKSLYDKESLQTNESQKFAEEIEAIICPVFKKYLEKGFSVRDLSHEAQSAIRDHELDHMVSIHMEKAKRAKKNLERRKMDAEVKKSMALPKEIGAMARMVNKYK